MLGTKNTRIIQGGPIERECAKPQIMLVRWTQQLGILKRENLKKVLNANFYIVLSYLCYKICSTNS